jgi:hypothetical protein
MLSLHKYEKTGIDAVLFSSPFSSIFSIISSLIAFGF